MTAYRHARPSVPSEIRLIGRLVDDPEPNGDGGVSLRLIVTYGIERHQRRVLATGRGAEVARQLHAGDLIYLVGRVAPKDSEHEIEAEHILALQPASRTVSFS